jgi:ribosomal protein S18 acetylase RimI-like enzyme
VSYRIERLGPGDESRVLGAADLFDEPPTQAYTRRFLSEPTHHLLVAYEDDEPAGFVSGIEVAHPDKPVEMLLYELGVREASRRRGIGMALVEALREVALERGCAGMWVLTDDDNEAALRTYRRAGAHAPSAQLMLEWVWGTSELDPSVEAD